MRDFLIAVGVVLGFIVVGLLVLYVAASLAGPYLR